MDGQLFTVGSPDSLQTKNELHVASEGLGRVVPGRSMWQGLLLLSSGV